MDDIRKLRIIGRKEQPLVEVSGNEWNSIDRFLKLRDRAPVKDVFGYLYEKGFTPIEGGRIYIGGSVISEYLFGEKGNYKDIDILAVTRNEEFRIAVSKELYENSRYFHTDDISIKITKKMRLELPKVDPMLIGTTNFLVRSNDSGGYMEIRNPEGFTLRPKSSGLRRVLGTPSDIDLNLAHNDSLLNSLERTYGLDQEMFKS